MSIQIKRSLSSNIDNAYVLLQGQLGIEMMQATNTSESPFRLKIGDGVTVWEDLPYLGPASVSEEFNQLVEKVGSLEEAVAKLDGWMDSTTGNVDIILYDVDNNQLLTIKKQGIEPGLYKLPEDLLVDMPYEGSDYEGLDSLRPQYKFDESNSHNLLQTMVVAGETKELKAYFDLYANYTVTIKDSVTGEIVAGPNTYQGIVDTTVDDTSKFVSNLKLLGYILDEPVATVPVKTEVLANEYDAQGCIILDLQGFDTDVVFHYESESQGINASTNVTNSDSQSVILSIPSGTTTDLVYWCTAKRSNINYISETNVLDNITSPQYVTLALPALAPVQFTVTYYVDNTIVYTQSVQENTDAILYDYTGTKSGYDFIGWNTNATATSAQYAEGQSLRITNNISLYGIWKEQTFDFVVNVQNFKNLGDNIRIFNRGNTNGVFTYDTRSEWIKGDWSGEVDASTKKFIAKIPLSQKPAVGDNLFIWHTRYETLGGVTYVWMLGDLQVIQYNGNNTITTTTNPIYYYVGYTTRWPTNPTSITIKQTPIQCTEANKQKWDNAGATTTLGNANTNYFLRSTDKYKSVSLVYENSSGNQVLYQGVTTQVTSGFSMAEIY